MKSYTILDNTVSVESITFTGIEAGISPVVVLREVRLSYETDADGNRTDRVEACRYSVLDTSTYGTFVIKVKNDKPVITAEQLENAKEHILLDIPVEEVIIKPFSIEYGRCRVSVTAPFVKLHKN